MSATDLDRIEEHLLNVELDAKRRCARGELTREALAVIVAQIRGAVGTTRVLAMALPPQVREGAR